MSVRGGAARLPSTSVRALRLTKLFANLPHHEIKDFVMKPPNDLSAR